MANQTSKRSSTDIISAPSTDARLLPAPVAAMRSRILEACAKGDIEALRIPIDWNEMRPMLGRAPKRGPGEDPVDRLKALSFDGNGRETIDLLRAVLRRPFVTVTKGPTTLYVWPSFALAPPTDPTPEQREAMLACVRFADLRGAETGGIPRPMEIAIGADGVWHYFWTSAAPDRRG